MSTLICGSVAYDNIMVFKDRFKDCILPDQIHILNVCFLVPDIKRVFGGCAGNIAYNLKLLGGDPLIMATLVLIIAAIIALSFAIFIAADRIDRYLGDTGRNVLTRLLGVLLASLAVQFVADGIKAIMA